MEIKNILYDWTLSFNLWTQTKERLTPSMINIDIKVPVLIVVNALLQPAEQMLLPSCKIADERKQVSI